MFQQVDVQTFASISYLLWVLSLILIAFAAVAFARFVENRSMVALFFALSFASLLAAATASNVGVISVAEAGRKTAYYYAGIVGMNLGIVATSCFLYLFYSEVAELSRERRTWVVGLALAIILFELLPANQWSSEEPGFKLKYVSYLVQTIYCCAAYLGAGFGFVHLAGKAPEKKLELRMAAAGNFLLVVFFLMMLSRAFAGDSGFLRTLQVGSWVVMMLAVAALFVGFVLPTIESHAKVASGGGA
ncbi:MAG: hypothetical protein Kow0069_37520 [Promethearchaeota archaeon]